VPKCVNIQRDEQSAAAEQGNGREKAPQENIATPARIRRKAQIGHASHIAEAKKWPK